jgi:hypothetical protein
MQTRTSERRWYICYDGTGPNKKGEPEFKFRTVQKIKAMSFNEKLSTYPGNTGYVEVINDKGVKRL